MKVIITGIIEDFLEQATHDLDFGDEIEVLIDLNEIRQEVKEFAVDSCELIHPDNCDCGDLSDYDTDDLMDELADRGYTGWDVEDDSIQSLDLIDSRRLDEIVQRFKDGTLSEREELYNKIMNL